MIKYEVFKIKEALSHAEKMPRQGILYFSPELGLSLDRDCALLTEWNWDEDEDPPEFLLIEGVKMIELLPMESFQQVVENALDQSPSSTDSVLLSALKYYCEFDAFIDFNAPQTNSR